MTIFSTIHWRPHLIWPSSHKEIWMFIKQVIGPSSVTWMCMWLPQTDCAHKRQACKHIQSQWRRQGGGGGGWGAPPPPMVFLLFVFFFFCLSAERSWPTIHYSIMEIYVENFWNRNKKCVGVPPPTPPPPPPLSDFFRGWRFFFFWPFAHPLSKHPGAAPVQSSCIPF